MTLEVIVAIEPEERGLKGFFNVKSKGPPGFPILDVLCTYALIKCQGLI
jgi:hypothetical protein